MSPRIEISVLSGRAMVSEDLEDLLDAAEELERQLDVESGVLLQELTGLLRRRTEFEKLMRKFGVPIHR